MALNSLNRWRKAVSKWRNPADLSLFLSILLFAASTPLLLRLRLMRMQSLLEPRSSDAMVEQAKIEKIISYAGYALRIASPLVRPNCLTRGLTLYYFLRRAGLEVKLSFGMGKVAGEFTGHCWLVLGGEPFLEAKDPRLLFTEMYSIPALDQ